MNAMPPPPAVRARPRKLIGLQYLRAVAALGVVSFHATHRAGTGWRVGEAGVDLFFALSGFLMVTITSEGTRPLAFLADRVRRIAPLYWIASSVMLAGVIAHLFPRVKLTAWHLISSYLFLPSWSPSSGELKPLLVPGWTLDYEMAFYVVFATLLLLRDQLKALIAITLLFGALVAARRFVPDTSAAGLTYTDPIVLEFVAGGWLGLAWKRGVRWPGWVAGPCVVAAVAMLWLYRDLPYTMNRALPFGVPAVLLLVAMLTVERRGGVPTWRLPLLLGDASYSIYLWHTLAVSVVLKLAAKLALGNIATILACFVIGTIVGVASYLLIEKPIMQLMRERKYVRGVPVPAGP